MNNEVEIIGVKNHATNTVKLYYRNNRVNDYREVVSHGEFKEVPLMTREEFDCEYPQRKKPNLKSIDGE